MKKLQKQKQISSVILFVYKFVIEHLELPTTTTTTKSVNKSKNKNKNLTKRKIIFLPSNRNKTNNNVILLR